VNDVTVAMKVKEVIYANLEISEDDVEMDEVWSQERSAEKGQ
jgi:hypothetical protein